MSSEHADVAMLRVFAALFASITGGLFGLVLGALCALVYFALLPASFESAVAGFWLMACAVIAVYCSDPTPEAKGATLDGSDDTPLTSSEA